MAAVLGSITDLREQHRGEHVVVGSHGGAPTGWYALRFGVASLICHDAGVGLAGAGIAALSVLEAVGVPAAAVGHVTARIGDADDMVQRGVISHANKTAQRLGVVPGTTVADAAKRFAAAHLPAVPTAVSAGESFGRVIRQTGGTPIVLLDSASSISDADDGLILITGSHGGLPGNRAERALRARPLFVVFNDAGIGAERAGIRRLAVLEELGIAAACVSAASAAIGSARSSYEDGVISSVNGPAAALGAQTGARLRPFVDSLARRDAGVTTKPST